MKRRIRMVYIFLMFIAVYHLISVGGVFGLRLFTPLSLAVGRDLMWILLVLFLLFGSGWKEIKGFFSLRGYECLIVIMLIVRSVLLSMFHGRSVMDMIIGYKYDIHFLVIALSAVCVGYICIKDKQKYRDQIVTYSRYGICFFLVGGVVFQLIKMGFPEIFSLFGYGPIGDYAVGSNPPLRYRTGPGGLSRLQGLFSGPNNFGYFLVGSFTFFAVQWWSIRQKKKSNKMFLILLASLFIISVIWTFSRGVLVGILAQLCVLVLFLGKEFIMKYRYVTLVCGIVVFLLVGGVGYLSIMKSGSTSLHLLSWQEGWHAFMNSPMGYGLGMAGPSVHHQGVYLPESQYLQMLLDVGIIGMLFWLIARKILLHPALSHIKRDLTFSQLPIYTLFAVGIVGLMVEGFFLHVREDSMVNYLLLVPFGLLLGMSRDHPFDIKQK